MFVSCLFSKAQKASRHFYFLLLSSTCFYNLLLCSTRFYMFLYEEDLRYPWTSIDCKSMPDGGTMVMYQQTAIVYKTPPVFIVREGRPNFTQLHTPAYTSNALLSPPTGLRLDVAGALLTKRVPRFTLPSTTIYDDSDIGVYQRPTILGRVWLL